MNDLFIFDRLFGIANQLGAHLKENSLQIYSEKTLLNKVYLMEALFQN